MRAAGIGAREMDRDFEKEAREDNWVDKDEWKGDEDKWVDAETFVKRGEEFAPFIKAKNRRLMEEIEGLKGRVNELQDGNKQFKEFHDSALKAEEQKRDKLIQELEEARAKAVEDSDGKAFKDADGKLQQIRAQEKKTENGAGKLSPEAQQWLEDHPQYNTDKKFHVLAEGLAGRIQDEITKGIRAQLSNEDFYKTLTKEMQEIDPDLFENKNRGKQTVEGGGNKGGGNSKAKTFENLPDDAKKACQSFEKSIPGFTKEQYLKEYVWD